MGARSKSLFKGEASISPWSVSVPLSFRSGLPFLCLIGVFPICAPVLAQNSAAPPPVTFTADQDHQNMMDQLGIKALRPGAKRERECSESRQLRRVQGQSLPECSRSAHHERRAKGDDGEDVVGQAPARTGGDVLKVCLRPRSQQRAQGQLDRHRRRSRDDRLHAGHRQGPHRRGRQLVVPGNQRQAFT